MQFLDYNNKTATESLSIPDRRGNIDWSPRNTYWCCPGDNVKLESEDEKTHLLNVPNVLAIVSANPASVLKTLSAHTLKMS